MSSRRWEDRSQVTVAERSRTFEFVTNATVHRAERSLEATYRHRYEIVPTPGGSMVTYEMTQLTLANPFLRLSLPVVRPFPGGWRSRSWPAVDSATCWRSPSAVPTVEVCLTPSKIACGFPSQLFPKSAETFPGVRIVSVLTMGKPDLRQRPGPARGEIQADESGYLQDAAMRRTVVELGGGSSVEVLEALAALRLAAKQIRDSMERFAERQGLSESRLRVLMRLSHSSSRQLPLGALAEGMDVTPRTMTDIIDVLERDGLVKRVPDPADRRSVQAVITEAGLACVDAVQREAVVSQAAVAKGFTADQLVQLRHLCLLLVRNLSTDQEGS